MGGADDVAEARRVDVRGEVLGMGVSRPEPLESEFVFGLLARAALLQRRRVGVFRLRLLVQADLLGQPAVVLVVHRSVLDDRRPEYDTPCPVLRRRPQHLPSQII